MTRNHLIGPAHGRVAMSLELRNACCGWPRSGPRGLGIRRHGDRGCPRPGRASRRRLWESRPRPGTVRAGLTRHWQQFLFSASRAHFPLNTCTPTRKLTTGEFHAKRHNDFMCSGRKEDADYVLCCAVLYRITSKVQSPDLIFQIRRFFHYRRRVKMVRPEREAGLWAFAPGAHR